MLYSTHNVATFQSSHDSESNDIEYEPHLSSYHDDKLLSISIYVSLY
ncbi:hypothetical protein PSENEW3_10000054 (chloroplast) [Picochlorum sp. SENEW3]|jgi:hypothetical protein|nr:hypothetical protein PSENEW3_10000054 [Picochlorum sp. SENEW3]